MKWNAVPEVSVFSIEVSAQNAENRVLLSLSYADTYSMMISYLYLPFFANSNVEIFVTIK